MIRCAACSGKNNVVPWDGPCNDYAFIGEGPGWDENRRLIPFSGKTGDEVNRHYMPLAGLARPQVRVGNAISCLPDRTGGKLDIKRTADLELLESCAGCHLYPELESHKYRVIIPLGAFACRAIDPDIDLELQHGMPIKTAWGDAFPMYHPAGGIHEPKKMLHIRTDWYRLGQYLKGRLQQPKDPYAGRERYKVLSKGWEVDQELEGFEDYPLANDTEITRYGDPFCLTFSCQPGTGFMIRADNQECLDAYQRWLDRWRGIFLWHNWLFDCDVVGNLRLQYRVHKIVDTMLKCFHLGNVPLGLKALAFREMGMKMMDFDDLVTPYSNKLILTYYQQAFREEWARPEAELVRGPDGKWKSYQAQSVGTKLKRFLGDFSKDPTKDVFKAWENWEGSQAEIESRLGPWPGKCITHAWAENPDQVLWYAARDADALLRLWPIIQGMSRQVRRRPQECWRQAA